MTTGKIIALTKQIFVGKVMSLFFNMLSKKKSKILGAWTGIYRSDLRSSVQESILQVPKSLVGDTITEKLEYIFSTKAKQITPLPSI